MAIDKFREPGTIVWFEYHCWEDHNSADAELWYHSHQQATVGECENAEEFGHMTQEERIEAACPLAYKIKFADGFTHTGIEDELVDSREEFYCSDPPEPRR
jgi:hypothetical protein